ADQGAFDLERRDAVAARLHHVVVATLEPEVALLVAGQHVAGAVPRAAEDVRRLRRLVPVALHHARMAVAADAQLAVLAGTDRAAGVVLQLDDRAGARAAAAPRLERKTDGIEAVDHALGHADAVERPHAEMAAHR